MTNIAIFASGSGTNAENIARYFEGDTQVRVALLVTNRKEAGVIERIKPFGIPTVYVPKAKWQDEAFVNNLLNKHQIKAIVLAGYLLQIPAYLINMFHERIVNIHPALLPSHGGKGMYGMNVHEDVLRCGDKETGITIHLVDEQYDHGRTLFQAKCPVLPTDSPEEVAAKVHQLEYKYFPEVIDRWLKEI